jgi:hypothetical protein
LKIIDKFIVISSFKIDLTKSALLPDGRLHLYQWRLLRGGRGGPSSVNFMNIKIV